MSSTSRRAHHKSRAGCATYKTKKVKCDEKAPCSYCVKRHLPCSLAALSSPGTNGSSERDPTSGASLLVPPLYPLHGHRLDDGASVAVWREAITELATRYPYLLHEVLAIAALHLRSVRPERAGSLGHAAAKHQANAIPLFRKALATSSAETAPPLFACSCPFVPYHFAAAKDASSLLFNEETGSLAEWVGLIQGCAAITMEHGATIMRSPLRALLGDLHTPKLEDLKSGPTDARLLSLGAELPVAAEQREAYAQVLVKLRLCFYLSDRAGSVLDRKNAALRFPAALVVMAFWCVLLYRVQDRWWLTGRVQPLLRKIEELVPLQHRDLVRWPLEETGVYTRADV
ncbi:hypothetical protein AAE478_004903 [Parahypoxylon ruwenzoriense]